MFRKIDPSYETVLEEWRNGPISIVVQAYAFGQYRIQVWYQTLPAPAYPEILAPEC